MAPSSYYWMMQKHPILTLDEDVAPLTDGARLACGLRDFFLARDAGEMAAAATRVADAAQASAPTELRDESGRERTEYAFNRLFVGPMALLAPPFASVYLDPEPLVMGGTTLNVREVYHALGLASALEGRLPDDHLGLELECAATMRAGLDRVRDPLLAELHAWFVTEHMAAWIPAFVRRVAKAAQESAADPVVDFCIAQLVRWLVAEVAAINENCDAPSAACSTEPPSPDTPGKRPFVPDDTAAEPGNTISRP